MNWYKELKYALTTGEYWIMGGQVVGADSDIGDYNHEGYAIESAQYQIMDGEGDWENWKWEAASEVFDSKMEEAITPEQKQQLQQQWNEDQDEFLMEALRERGVSAELYQMSEGHGDIRNLAMKLWGWKRLCNTDVQTWTIDDSDVNEIADGIYDAYSEDAETMSFTIEVMSTGQIFDDIPFTVLSERGLGGLAYYLRRI